MVHGSNPFWLHHVVAPATLPNRCDEAISVSVRDAERVVASCTYASRYYSFVIKLMSVFLSRDPVQNTAPQPIWGFWIVRRSRANLLYLGSLR